MVRLWPDTAVDVDHNLNTAIIKIREALGDWRRARAAETLPRRGYRFIGPLTLPALSVSRRRNRHTYVGT
jgi:DNA-binding winged helix-turn-helix (wHTH) protein